MTEVCNFERKKSKMSTALGIVAHFGVNSQTRTMEEFSFSSQFKQKEFKQLRSKGLALENVVYYQGVCKLRILSVMCVFWQLILDSDNLS